jgi:hypothetical protein
VIVDFDKLVALLRRYGPQNDVPAGHDLVVQFKTEPRIAGSETFETYDGLTLLVDLDSDGKVVSIEIT